MSDTKPLNYEAIQKLSLPSDVSRRREVVQLQRALSQLHLEVAKEEISRGEFGESTKEAIRELQARAGLPVTSEPDAATVARIKAELEHRFFTESKTRTARLHQMLTQLGYEIAEDERKARIFGSSTQASIRSFENRLGDDVNRGLVHQATVEQLRAQALATRLSSKTQVGQLQKTLLRAAKIGRLDVAIDREELKAKELGRTSRAAIAAFQEKYHLPVTGQIDPATFDKIKAVDASRPKPPELLKVRSLEHVSTRRSVLRLNMTNADVPELQRALAFFGYPVNAREFKDRNFGKSTRSAVLDFQRANGLPPTGHADRATLKQINKAVAERNPAAAAAEFSYRLRGTVRDELWNGIRGATVQVFERPLRGDGAMLAQRPTLPDGFYDVPYQPPLNPATKQVKKPFHLLVKFIGPGNVELGRRVLFNPTLIAWANFTKGDQPYRGTSEFDARMAVVTPALHGVSIATIEETDQRQEVTHAAVESGLSQDDVMRLLLAHRVATELNHNHIGAAACYAFFRQHLPPNLPDDLLASTHEWTLIDQLVDQAAAGLVFMEPELQVLAFDNAVVENLIPIAVGKQRDVLLAALNALRTTFALDKPLLIGNGTLRSLLDVSEVPTARYTRVAEAFVAHGGMGDEFWTDVRANADQFGGAGAVADLQMTADIGQIAKNHLPTVTFLKERITDGGEARINSSRDLAKLTVDEWVGFIEENGGVVPPGTDGATHDEKVAAHAGALSSQSERLFPTVALVAEVARSAETGLTMVAEAQAFIDTHTEFDLRQSNVDKYVADNAAETDAAVIGDLRVMQRVHRLAPTAETGRVLLEQKLHSSSQIVALGKEGVVRSLGEKGVDERMALTIHGYAELQYAQVLLRLAEYRPELHLANPTAIPDGVVTLEEARTVLGDIPNLEVLFGSLHYCDCAHCQSVYGPAAYLADLLRFLSNHRARAAGQTVLDVLFQRRPDIGNIKLNCPNTETPMPYVDLVCEILEGAVPAPATAPNHTFQTTRSAAELRAFPEHVRPEAYSRIRDADFPVDGGFDLAQEEARLFLGHLGVPRHELMWTFQTTTAPVAPSDMSIAAEYFGISSHEASLIITANATSASQNQYWGFDTTRTQVPVSEFLAHARIDYPELLALLQVRWLARGGVAPVELSRPNGTCDLNLQRLTGLTVAAFDRIHRFLRLRRHTNWSLWQLDLLLRASSIGGENLDANKLFGLHRFALVEGRLRLSFEKALSLYEPINTETRRDPVDSDVVSEALYQAIFTNPAVINPVNPAFALPLSGSGLLADHRPALLAAFAVTEPELALLLARSGPNITLLSLSALFRIVTLARALGLSITDLITLMDLSADVVADPFASPEATRRFLECYDALAASTFTVTELDYVLNARPASPFGLRDEVITQQVEALRESLRTKTSAQKAGQIAAQVASTFGLTDQQASTLLAALPVNGATAMERLAIDALTARNASDEYTTPVTPANFPHIYASWRALHKVALVVQRMRVRDDFLAWLLSRSAAIGALDLVALPVDAAPPQRLFGRWRTLAQWLAVRAQYPEPEGVSLQRILDLTSAPGTTVTTVRTSVASLTGWRVQDLAEIDGASVAAYRQVETWLELRTSFAQLRRLGVTAAVARRWALRDVAASQAEIAQEIKQTAKSKYDPEVWLSIVTPLQDTLREKKRDALVAFLVENSLRTVPPTITVAGTQYRNPAYWPDPNDLLKYFLIDVEMSSCQLTSRVKQAIGSVQMFVQRCLLNLEKSSVIVTADERADTASLDSWRQWRWMKNYRVWEANRKVFLYPENWIEPELRDDKTPFFVELENEILQSEITDEHCEAAFLHYLQKVHEVARLTIVGMYHEVDDENPYDNLPPNVNVVHVIGRTRSDPARYYYRQFDVNYGTWTGWEKIELDITGEHVVPVVYNRKLHLFWLIFTDKAQKVRKQPPARATAAPTDSPEPQRILEIQLAWSVRKDGGWTNRQVAPHKLVHPWQRPTSSYNLKPRYKARENHLWMDVYISTSLEFNNTRFYDPYTNANAFVTAFRFDETARPWHASSFVFDGNVVALKLKELRGQYHVLDANGMASDALVATTSYRYVRDAFPGNGSTLQPLSGGYEIAPRLVLPTGMHFSNTRLANNKANPNPNQVNVLEAAQTVTLLAGGQRNFDLAFSQHHVQFDTAAFERSPFFYQDDARSYFVRSEWRRVLLGYNQVTQRLTYTWYPSYHPYTSLFLRELNRGGVDGLLNRKIQRFPNSYYPGNSFSFTSTYQPTNRSAVDTSAEHDTVDFSQYGAYAGYNWEIFFHAPMLIAARLTQNQRFEEAMQWYHRIFDPTNTEGESAPQRYWITRPFFERGTEEYRRQRIENLLADIGANLEQVRAWKNNPFKPHLIARYRPVAYQKAVVMKYLDNLLAWGDQLFRQESLEAINQATLLYVLAYELLGRRPEKVPAPRRTDRSYRELTAEQSLDPFGNQRVDVVMENFVPPPRHVVRTNENAEPLPHLVLYFGIPTNDTLVKYWETVEDRLFKVRHCMNIEGVVRQLPLFEPPIDPALLVKAAAAGVDISSVLSPSAVPVGQYRFSALAGKALELCNEVRALGDRLVTVLERGDAEGLALLHSVNEVALQRAVRRVREQQIVEAQRSWRALEQGLDSIDKRIQYYGSIPYMNTWEVLGTVSHSLGIASEIVATVLGAVAGTAPLVPTIKAGAAGFGGSPTLTVEVGGKNVGDSSRNFANMFTGIGNILHQAGQLLDAQGAFTRQDEANKFQRELAALERAQLVTQIEAGKIRYEIAQRELENHDLAIIQSQGIDEYLRGKYTNRQLYDWMLRQLSTVYFQSYQLAYDMARRAEKCFQFELASPDASFIQFGYWDSLKKGLLAADRLANDVRRMEAAYLERNQREFELTKHVSLAQVAPLSLLALKLTGACTVQLPEWLYDIDHPGHYRRRIKSVAVTIPSVVGPYSNINCSLSLTNNGVRLTDSLTGGYGDPLVGTDSRFARNPVPTDSIVTSHGVNDRGMFELGFNDDRYLPFEGAGAVSEWRLSLPPENNQFDLATISDVILHIDYTAIRGSDALATAARGNVNAALPARGVALYVLDQQFGTEWYRFLHPPAGEEQLLDLTFGPEHIPFWARVRSSSSPVQVRRIDLVVDSAHTGAFDSRVDAPGPSGAINVPAPRDPTFGNLPHLAATFAPGTPLLGAWRLQLKTDSAPDFTSLQDGDIRHAYLLVSFTAS